MPSYIYSAYGLHIHSNIALPDLPILSAKGHVADVAIKVQAITCPDFQASIHSCRFVNYLDDIGWFVISDGCEIHVQHLPKVCDEELRLAILGPALSVVLRQRGLLVLHASCVALEDRAIAFMGHSGWGKSTLAAAFHARGYNVLTDDVMAVDLSGDQPMVIPGYPQLKLWPNTAETVGYQDDVSPLFPDATKCSYRFSQQFQPTPLPLSRLYVLAKDDEHWIRPMSEQRAFAALTCHTRAMQAMNDKASIQKHLMLSSKLIQNISIKEFARKPDLGDLSRLVDMVLEDMEAKTLNPVP